MNYKISMTRFIFLFIFAMQISNSRNHLCKSIMDNKGFKMQKSLLRNLFASLQNDLINQYIYPLTPSKSLDPDYFFYSDVYMYDMITGESNFKHIYLYTWIRNLGFLFRYPPNINGKKPLVEQFHTKKYARQFILAVNSIIRKKEIEIIIDHIEKNNEETLKLEEESIDQKIVFKALRRTIPREQIPAFIHENKRINKVELIKYVRDQNKMNLNLRYFETLIKKDDFVLPSFFVYIPILEECNTDKKYCIQCFSITRNNTCTKCSVIIEYWGMFNKILIEVLDSDSDSDSDSKSNSNSDKNQKQT
ncbi:hypothetical protein NUSPORA_02476 [Nucleospora cyclopteri]